MKVKKLFFYGILVNTLELLTYIHVYIYLYKEFTIIRCLKLKVTCKCMCEKNYMTSYTGLDYYKTRAYINQI